MHRHVPLGPGMTYPTFRFPVLAEKSLYNYFGDEASQNCGPQDLVDQNVVKRQFWNWEGPTALRLDNLILPRTLALLGPGAGEVRC